MGTGKIERFAERVNAIGGGVCAALLAILFVIVVYSVFQRYVLRNPVRWVMDVGELTLIVLAYLPLAYVQQHRGHASVDILVEKLHGRPRVLIEMFASVVTVFLGFLLVWRGETYALEALQRGKVSTIALLPEYPALFFIPLGGALLMLQSLTELARGIVALRVPHAGKDVGEMARGA